jgi:L-aspartate oxidase
LELLHADRITFDGPVLILGAGLAGLTACAGSRAPPRAGAVARRPWPPAAPAPGPRAAWPPPCREDAPALHAADTIAAGAGLCDPHAVDLLTTEGPAAVRALAALGAPFDRKPDGGSCSAWKPPTPRPGSPGWGRRAGAAIMAAVIAAVRAAPAIEVRENARARRLLQDKTGRVRGAGAQIDGGLVEILAPP